MKSKFLEFCYSVIGFIFNIINYKRPKILIYSDSRGFDVVGKYGKNPFKSYIKGLIFNFNTDFYICPKKHTTLLDFLALSKKINLKKYDKIIVHCGVVDFSPRPLNNLNWVLESKNENEYFKIAQKKYKDYYLNPSDTIYQNEKTQNLYSLLFLKEIVIPELKKIDNLIWINSNHFINDWDGNFKKGRPLNIEEYVNRFDNLMKAEIKNVIDLKVWDNDTIKKYTIDNIHFNNKGFAEIYNMIQDKILT